MTKPNSSSVDHALDAIRAGKLLAIPTETVYGLGADASNCGAIKKIYQLKGRPTNHPLIVHVASAASVKNFASEVPAFAQTLMTQFWPGPLTLILPRLPDAAAAAAG